MSVISITDDAKTYISNRCVDGKILAVSVNNKGCSGHSYSYELISSDQIEQYDELISWDTGGIVIRANSVMKLFGSKLDIKSSILEEILMWTNPLATNMCGCGESFSLNS